MARKNVKKPDTKGKQKKIKELKLPDFLIDTIDKYRYMYIKRMDSLEVIYILDKDAEKYNLSKNNIFK